MLGTLDDMPIHPSPPVDLLGKVTALQHGMQAIIDLAFGCSDTDLDLPTPCPGWTVRDQLAHIADIEAMLDGAPHQEVELSERSHLRDQRAEWTEHGVQRRRAHSKDELLDELQTLMHNRHATLSNPELDLETEVPGLRHRPTRLGTLLDLRLVDVWVHEQDIREALDHPGNLDTVGAATFMQMIIDALPTLVATRLQPEIGTTVMVESTGPVTGRAGVRMIADDDGHPVPHALFTGEPDPAHVDADPEHPADPADHDAPVATVSIVLSTDALTRRAAGRRSTEDTLYRVVGDEDLARRVLDALPMTP